MAQTLSLATLGSLPAGIARPGYDRANLTAGIVHIGVGNFHRAHQAVYMDRLFNKGLDLDWAIVGAGVKSFDVATRERLQGQDWLTTVVELDPEQLSARVTGAMIDFLPVDPQAVLAKLCEPSIRIVSLTVTEGGYFVDAVTGGFDAAHPDMQHDAAHPEAPQSVFGIMIAALKARRARGIDPFTVMSCDNLPENGDAAHRAVVGLARLIDPELAGWIDANVAFPNGMVDCITPATTQAERDKVTQTFGVQDAAPVTCEPFRQWVLEDRFPGGRPALEKVGVEFVADVKPYELMKLRILNGGHAAIAYISALLGYEFVHDAMADEDVRDWYRMLATTEILPTLKPIEGVDYAAYLDNCIKRFSNSAVADRVPRLCLDGSNRQPKFILPTVADALAEGRPVTGLALEVALWCRYCANSTLAGGTIQLEDERAEQLTKAALATETDAAAFLRQRDVFGDLGQNATFAAAFAGHIGRLWSVTPREALQHYIESQAA